MAPPNPPFAAYVARAVRALLLLLAVIVTAAAAIATVVGMPFDFPVLLHPTLEETVPLYHAIEDALLIAIAAEFALLLVFHEPENAIDIVVFVIARKMVSPKLSAFDLVGLALALAALVVVSRFVGQRAPPAPREPDPR